MFTMMPCSFAKFARFIGCICAHCLVIVAVAALAQAQETLSIAGQVFDQDGALITSARVTLTPQEPIASSSSSTSNRVVRVDALGKFNFAGIAPGAYRLTAYGEGFALASRTVTLDAAPQLDVNLTLSLGEIAEVVAVSATQIIGDTESQRRIPGALSTLDRGTLETSRVFTFTEALRKLPGVNVRDEEGFGLRPNIGIRGLNPTRSSKVLLLEDGIPLTYAPYGDNASYYHPPIDRFDSIEVLKGSGQILYGPTTVGGVVNYVTPEPPAEQAGSVTLIGGSRDYFNARLNYGNTFGRTGILFDFLRKQGAGARDNIRTGLNDFNFKSITALGSRQALTTRFNYYGERSQIAYTGATEAEFAANPRANIFLNDRFTGNRFGASATHAFVFNNNLVLTTDIYAAHFSRDWWRQSSNSLQRPNDASDPNCAGIQNLYSTCGNEGRLRDYLNFGVAPRLRASFRFLGVRNETDFGFRFHFEDQERIQKNGDTPTARDGRIVENNERRTHAYSGFIQNRFDIGSFSITPGLRLEQIRYARTNRLLDVSGETDLTQLVPGIGVAYRAPGNTVVFAGAHRGFAPPRVEDAVNNTTGGSIELDPELSWNYELGVRANPRRGLQLEATLFRMDYENQIVPANLAGGIGSLLTNGGQTLHQGFEFSGRLDSSLFFASAHNLYLRAAHTFIPTARFTGTRLSSISTFNTTSITGNRLPYAPEQIINAAVGYTNADGFDALVELVHTGSQFADDINLVSPLADSRFTGSTLSAATRAARLNLARSGQLGSIPSSTIWNATVNYNVENLDSTFFITAKNLFDTLYIADRSRGILPGTPRLVQAGIKYRF